MLPSKTRKKVEQFPFLKRLSLDLAGVDSCIIGKRRVLLTFTTYGYVLYRQEGAEEL